MRVVYLHQCFKFPYERGSTRCYDLAVSSFKESLKVVINDFLHSRQWQIHLKATISKEYETIVTREYINILAGHGNKHSRAPLQSCIRFYRLSVLCWGKFSPFVVAIPG